jgi:Phosphotransferase enzyme family
LLLTRGILSDRLMRRLLCSFSGRPEEKMENRASDVPTENLIAHPAVRAWSKLHHRAAVPCRIQALRPPRKRRHKASAFRVDGIGPKGSSIVAKLCLRETAELECLIYESILPKLSIPRLEYYGTIRSEDPERDWIFVEDAGDERYSRNDGEHRRLAAEWIATLHTSAQNLPALKQLPDRGPAHYLNCLRAARRRIDASRSNAVITRDQRTVLDRVDAYLQLFEDSWSDLERLCQSMPRTLIHGDLGGRNGRIKNRGGHRTLVVFDWETAGTGVPAADLTSSRIDALSCCLDTYFSHTKGAWPFLTLENIVLFERIGRIFRLMAAINWATLDLSFERADCIPRPISYMQSYFERIEYELQDPVWTSLLGAVSGTFGNASQSVGAISYSDLGCGVKE